MKDYLIREEEVCRRLCIGRATLAQWIKDGAVSPPVRTRPNKAWRSSSIDRYIDRIEEIEIARSHERPTAARAPVESNEMAVLRLPDVLAMVGISRTTLYRLLSEGTFPGKVKLTERTVGWRRDEVERWITTRARN